MPDAQPAPDHDDLTESPQTTTAPGDIVERTLIPSSSQGYDTGAGLYLYNRTDKEVDLSGVAAAPVGFTLAPAEEGPQILIYHSHATEAYTPRRHRYLHSQRQQHPHAGGGIQYAPGGG